MTTLSTPLRAVDSLLDRITMYRLLLYALLAYIGVAAVLAAVGLLPFSPVALLLSTAFLLIMCWAANTLLAWVFRVPTNVESAAITALILALIVDPAKTSNSWQFLGWAAILAMASKYVLGLWSKHIFNPAAVAVVITAFTLGDSASWWVGTASMLPVTIVGGYLIVRKVRQETMVGVFVLAALVTECIASLVLRLSLPVELQRLLIESPLFFFASIMLTEPLTSPTTAFHRRIYAALVGVLFVPQLHLGALYSTPELALIAGNVYAYAVSPKQRLALKLRQRKKLAPNILEFTFRPERKLAFAPGQYMEFTLGHPHADSRGNRRYFTLASSPTEDQLRLGVRFSRQGSSYKRAMQALDGRTPLVGMQVAGDFTLPEDRERKLVFIAGGIGITPFRSMLKYLLDTRQRRDIVLFDVNRSPDEIVYRDVLTEAQTKLGVQVIYTLTDKTAIPDRWTGERGRVTAKMIQQTVPDYQDRLYYLSGPPEMVRASEHELRALGIHRSQIKKDYFAGL